MNFDPEGQCPGYPENGTSLIIVKKTETQMLNTKYMNRIENFTHMTPFEKITVNLLVPLLFLVLMPETGFAQFTDTKELSKYFRVTDDTKIEIVNKYGLVKIDTWDKDSVVVDINIRVEEKKLSRLEKIMEQITFEFTEGKQFLYIRTKTEDNLTTLEKEFMRFKESLLIPGGKTEINMTIKMPKNNPARIENKFGDILLNDYSGSMDLFLSNGNLKAQNLSGKLNLTLNFADATVNEIRQGRLDCNYSDIIVRKAGSLQIISKSSDIEIYEIQYLSTDSRRDKYQIRKIYKMDARGSFSNFRIEELSGQLSARTEYGNLNADRILPEFINVVADSRSTNLTLSFHPDSDFGFEVTTTKTNLWLTGEAVIKKEETLNEKEERKKISGTLGNKNSKNNKLIINAVSGEINILSE